MIRKSARVIAALGLALALATSGSGQGESARDLEIRLYSLSYGYLRPLTATAKRLAALPELRGIEPLGHRDGVTTFKLNTALSGEKISQLLGLRLIAENKDSLLLAPRAGLDLAGAEARPRLLAIVKALSGRVRLDAHGTAEPAFDRATAENAAKCLEALGIPLQSLKGEIFAAEDYHIEQSAISGVYTIWAGKSYQGLPAVGRHIYGLRDERASLDPDLRVPFVGCKIAFGRYSSGFYWVDAAGCELNDYGFERNAEVQHPTKELAVKAGGRRVRAILLAAARYRQQQANREKKVEELPSGWLSEYSLANELQFKDRDHGLWQHFPEECFHLGWSLDANAGKVLARVRAHHRHHPLYLDAILDADASLDSVTDKDSPNLGVVWTCAPEEDLADFKKRRDEAQAGIDVLRKALLAADVADLDKLCGNLGDSVLRARLKVNEPSLTGTFFHAADYDIERQMFQDVLVAVGRAAKGGRRWQLINLKAREVIRTGQ